MSILVHCPLNASYPRLYAKALTSLFEMVSAEPYELVYGVSAGVENAAADKLSKLERARRLAVASNADGLLVVEHDVQVPADTLERLTAVDAPAVSAVTVRRKWPHAWQTGMESGVILYRPERLRDNGWLCGDKEVVVVDDLYCSRLSLEDGGKSMTPDPDEHGRVRVEYFDPVRAPATVPYTQTLLGKAA